LSCVAAFEIATMVLYTVFSLRFGSPETLSDPPEGFSFRWTAFLAFYTVASIALHSITLYLVVTAAFIRYWSVRTISSKWRHHNVSRTVAVVSAAVAILCIPTFLLHSIVPTSDAGRGLYRISLSGVGSVQACSLFFANLWLTGVFFK
ncbi:Protein DMSR-6, partial [Aphelenchoides avenae]